MTGHMMDGAPGGEAAGYWLATVVDAVMPGTDAASVTGTELRGEERLGPTPGWVRWAGICWYEGWKGGVGGYQLSEQPRQSSRGIDLQDSERTTHTRSRSFLSIWEKKWQDCWNGLKMGGGTACLTPAGIFRGGIKRKQLFLANEERMSKHGLKRHKASILMMLVIFVFSLFFLGQIKLSNYTPCSIL